MYQVLLFKFERHLCKGSIVCASPFWIHDGIELLTCLTKRKYNERPYDVIKFKMVVHWNLTRRKGDNHISDVLYTYVALRSSFNF